MAHFVSKSLDSGWEFKQTDDQSQEPWLPVAKMPSVVHLDLMAHNKIPDTSCDMNELAAHWVDDKQWSYRCQFFTPSNTPEDQIDLVFEGLDTFAQVWLNDKVILESDNMFIVHRINVTAYLHHNSLNILQIKFDPASFRGKAIQETHNEHRYLGSLGSSERLAVRKAQYHWGWDWGPAFLTVGPWRPVRLELYRGRIEDLFIQYELEEGFKSCQGTISARVCGNTTATVRLALRKLDGSLVFETTCVIDPDGLAKAKFSLVKPSLWYPHGYGDQCLYHLEGDLVVDRDVIHAERRRISFRQAELIQENDDYGKSFYFRINGTDVFAGGACWIPADSFVPRLSMEKYRDLLTLMVEGNQIMIRVWGGGIYEEEIFYDLCDELGILVWQDFMFACGSYPAFTSFLDSVEAEARCNVRRLRHHPSVIIYAGGNENYFIREHHGLTYNYEDDKDPQSWLQSNFPSRYIYEHLLPKVLSEEASSVIYHPDSPWGDGKTVFDTTVGDFHQWEVWHLSMRLYQEYSKIGGRFNSEFGMHACPHMSTIDQFITETSEKYPQSLTMDFHNKCRAHERRLALYVRENFRATNSSLKHWVYLTQLLQSEAVHHAYRGWRRQWGSPHARRCGGALVWQLNDCWPVTSWSIVDYFLVKKPSFYTIKRDLSPLTIGVVRTHEDWTGGHAKPPTSFEYDVWISGNGSNAAIDLITKNKLSAEVELRFISIRTGLESFPPQLHQVRNIQSNGTTMVLEDIQLTNPPNCDAFVISAKLLVGGQAVSQDTDWPQPFKYLSFHEDRGLQVKLTESRTVIQITASRPTKGLVFAERSGLDFSDNGFDVIPGETYVVYVNGLKEREKLDWLYLGIDESLEEPIIS